MNTAATFDIHFNNDTDSNNQGFKLTQEECEIYIANYNGTSHSYFADYKGGTASVVNNATGETVFQTNIK